MAADPMPTRRRRRLIAAAIVLLAGTVAVANLQVTTQRGLNYKVSTHRLPLYVKGMEFIDRDARYRQLAGDITKGLTTDRERLLAMFEWTRQNIRPTPEDWPVVDDHILNIIIRGHGMADQRADVFAMLATYAGVPAFWRRMRNERTQDGLVLTFARLDGRWAVFDVANGLVFRTRQGGLATIEDLAADPSLVTSAAGALRVGATPYPEFVAGLRTPAAPKPLRSELQMVWPRVWYETKAMLHLVPRDDRFDD